MFNALRRAALGIVVAAAFASGAVAAETSELRLGHQRSCNGHALTLAT